MKILLLSLTLTVAFAVPVPEWVPMDLPPDEGSVPLAQLLPKQGHVVMEDVKPDAGLEKVERPAEVSPVVQEKPVEQETVGQDKPAEQEPLVQDKPAEQEPLVQDKPAQQKPLVQDKPAEQEPLVQDKPAELEPVVQDKPAEQEPLVQDMPDEQEPLVQDEETSVEQVQEKVEEEDISEGPADEKDLTANEIKEETQPKEDVFDEESLDSNFLPQSEMERDYFNDEPEMRPELPVEEEPVVQEIHPAPGKPRLIEEPMVELVPEEEEAGMDGRLTEEEAEMAEEPKMELIAAEEERVEDDLEVETDLWYPRLRSVEEPTVELEPLLGEELTSDDEPGTEAQPAEEEELMEDEGPVMPGELVVEMEESQEQEPGMRMEPEEEPMPLARSGLPEGPLMDGMTLKQAMMEEEPVMWVGPDVVQETQEELDMPRADDESAAMPRGMDMDNDILMGVGSDIEEARPYVMEARTLEEEFPNTESTKESPCSGAIIDGRCYQYYRGPKQAADAEFFCQRNFPNGHLASITNPYIHQQMMRLMAQNGGYTRTWVGGLKYLKTGRFIWLDGAHWEYADWLPGEPNDTSGVEDCVELLSNGKFNDMPCWDLRAYICSFPL